MENGKEKPLEQDIKGADSRGYCRTGCIGRHECAEAVSYTHLTLPTT